MNSTKESNLLFGFPKKLVILIGLLFTFTMIAATVVLANNKTVVVEASVLNVRTGPGLSYDVMTQAFEEDQLKVIDEKNEWYKVRLADDKIGWVASWLVKNTEVAAASNYIGIVTGTKVNIRAEANTDSEILGTVTQDEELTVLFQFDNWVQIQYNGLVAWISSDFIDVTSDTANPPVVEQASNSVDATSQTVTIRGDRTNIRMGPSVENQVITQANQGEKFNYVSSEGDWYLISLPSGEVGYIANWTVDLSGSQQPVQPAKVTSLSEATIVIDAGHGGKDPGAVSQNLVEKELTIRTAQMLANKLRAFGTNVIMTREDDRGISLNDRVYTAHQINADAFISLHFDAIEPVNSMTGTTTYYYSETDRALADQINLGLAQNGPLNNNGVRKGNYFVLRENAQPSILLELGYINNTTDQKTIQSDHYRGIVTDSIVQSLATYYNH